MNTKFIYFDIGGVILHFRGAFPKLAQKYQLNADDVSRIFYKYVDQIDRGQILPQEFWQKFQQELGFIDEDSLDLATFWVDNFEPIPVTIQLIKDCHLQYKIGILSNVHRGIFKLLVRSGILPEVDWSAVVVSSQLGHIKPEPEIYQHAAQLASVKPQEILFIDDKAGNVQAALQQGWQGFVFDEDDPQKSVEQIRKNLKIME